MSFRIINCPSCNATLRIDEQRSICYCEYCGSMIRTQTPYSDGYNYELGRMNAQSERINRLILYLESVKETILAPKPGRNLARTEKELEKKTAKLQRLENSMRVRAVLLIVVLSIAAVAAFALTDFNLIVLAVSAVAGVAVFILRREKLKSRISKQALEVARNRENLNRYKNGQQQFETARSAMNGVSLPPEYETVEAIDFFCTQLRGGMATSLEQAIMLYEQKRDREKLMRLHEEQLELQRKQLEAMEKDEDEDEDENEESSSDLPAVHLDFSLGKALVGLAGGAFILGKFLKHFDD